MPRVAAPKRKILIVYGSRDAADTLAGLLTRLGHAVETAYDDAMALPVIRRMRPDVVFVDVARPRGDGFRIAAQIRGDSQFARTLIIAVTGFVTDEERSTVSELGIDLYLTRPIDWAFVRSFVGDPQIKR